MRNVLFTIPVGFLTFGIIALLFLCGGALFAQGAVFNGDFETGSYAPMWTLTGGNANTVLALFESKVGFKSWCLKRMTGTPSNNGGFEQTVHLVGGVTYVFSADIVAKYCST